MELSQEQRLAQDMLGLWQSKENGFRYLTSIHKPGDNQLQSTVPIKMATGTFTHNS